MESAFPISASIRRFARHYDKKAGVGTLVALMLPYTLITMIVWVVLFLAWYMLGLPWGPV
jgi:aminobenzoyl-glutamate transport protein